MDVYFAEGEAKSARSASAPETVVAGREVEYLVSPEAAILLSGSHIGPADARMWVGSRYGSVL